MKVLAIDTSSNVATVAVMDEDKLICEYVLNHKKTHSQKLMPMIKDVLENCELKTSDIDLFSVAIGPGSFTGLRIGVATAKALAHSVDKPIIGVSTLDSLAYSIPYFDGIICPILDAKRDQVYTAIYKYKQEECERLTDYMALSIIELIQKILTFNESTVFLGDGSYPFREVILENLKENAKFAPNFSMMQRASTVAEIALKRFLSGYKDDYMTLSPFYLRKSQAERQLEIEAND